MVALEVGVQGFLVHKKASGGPLRMSLLWLKQKKRRRGKKQTQMGAGRASRGGGGPAIA